ncbi:MAG TPA: HutP family protein [Candidatus Excrementavichristensenella intestinipullorum]|nr:HutP family protein [Candidatus Excrementavichristensenella intestinipullorum]
MESSNISGSRTVSRAAMLMCMTRTREEEKTLKAQLAAEEVRAAAVDYGGEFISSIMRIVERSVVAAKREGVISPTEYREEGAVAGATREALSQLNTKAIGLNVGGKIGVARAGNNIAVAVFFGIGLLHLNEVAVGLGHRAI